MTQNLNSETVDKLRRKSKESLFFFARAILGFDDLTKEIHRNVCRSLQDFKNSPRLAVILPRAWFKSTMGSIAYPIWRSLNDCNVRVLVVQNSFSNACKKLQAIKQIFEKNQLFRALFPDLLPTSQSTWTKECLTVNRTASHPEGTFEAAGTGTATTSRHYDCIIEDDTVAPDKDAMSGLVQQPTQLEIEKAIGWHRLTSPMLLHPSKSQVIVIGTRWAERDLLGWIIKNSPEYKIITRAVKEDKSGKPDSKGKIIWDRFDENVLSQLERDEGPYMFASLMLNSPTEAINQVFKRDWIQYYENTPKDIVCCTSVDPAAAAREESSDPDYNVVLTTGISPSTGEIYVIYYTRERMTSGQLIDAIFDHYKAYKPISVKVESIAYQRTLNYWIRQRQSQLQQFFYIDELKSLQGSKVDRVRGLQPYFANHKIHIRPHMSELERELLSFPKGSHDDIIDALSMQRDFWFDVSDSYHMEKKKDLRYDPLSGEAIIDELLSRRKNLNSYPADIGLMRERYLDSYPEKYRRDYV